jgi:hypothetical protein
MTERLLMRQVREILRLKHEQGLPHRAIARACGVGLGTVSEYCRRAQRAALTWPLPADLDDTQLEARLFRRVSAVVGVPRPVPDMAWIHQELKRPGVTLQRLHLEYLAREPDGYRYSQFCRHYHDWARALAPTMRQIHRAGEKAFVDFSGKRPVIYDVTTGEVRPVELFVGALGASSYVYAEACPAQDLAAWITAHVRMVEFSVARQRSSCPITSAAASPRHAATSPSSIAPTSSSPNTTARPWSPRAAATRATKPSSRRTCSSPNAGSWPCCATVASSASRS